MTGPERCPICGCATVWGMTVLQRREVNPVRALRRVVDRCTQSRHAGTGRWVGARGMGPGPLLTGSKTRNLGKSKGNWENQHFLWISAFSLNFSIFSEFLRISQNFTVLSRISQFCREFHSFVNTGVGTVNTGVGTVNTGVGTVNNQGFMEKVVNNPGFMEK